MPLPRPNSWQMALGGVFFGSLLAAAGCRVLGEAGLVLPAATPALALGVWAVFGHLVTLDDDLPGGWSNPDGDREIARASLVELGVKVLLLTVVLLVVWAG